VKGRNLGRLALGCLLFFAAPEAVASDARTSPHVVEIHVDGKPAAVAQTRSVATEILLRIPVMPVVLAEDAVAPSYATPDEPFVRAYFDFRSAAPRLVIVDGKTQRELDRRVLPEGSSLETSVEAVTHVLYMVVESLLDESAPETPPSPEPAPPPVAKPPETSVPVATPEEAPEPSSPPPVRAGAFGLETGIFFRTLYLGGAHLSPGAGLALDLRADRSEPQVSVAFALALHTPIEVALGGATARLQPFTAALLPSLQTELGKNVVGLFGAGASVTWFSLETHAAEGASVASSAGSADVALDVTAGLRFRLSSRIAMTLSGALEVGLAPRAFVGELGGERRVLAELPRLRPFVSLSATYSLLGPNDPGLRAEVD